MVFGEQSSLVRRMLPAPVPVFLVYQTAFVDIDGTLQFRPDVYNRDAEIWPYVHPVRQPVAELGRISSRAPDAFPWLVSSHSRDPFPLMPNFLLCFLEGGPLGCEAREPLPC